MILDLSFSNLSYKERSYVTHCYHYYPASFIPQLAGCLIDLYAKPGTWIYDPFAGSGTTLVEAKIRGYNSIGCDINPLACLIANAKSNPIEPNKLHAYVEEINHYAKNEYKDNIDYTNIIVEEYFPFLLHWFRKDVLNKLSFLYNKISNYDADIRDFMLVGLSHIMRKVSYQDTRSIKPYRNVDKNIPDVFKVFIHHIKKMETANNEFYNILHDKGYLRVESRCYHTDSRCYRPSVSEIGFILTSPPYGISYDYYTIHKISIQFFNAVGFWHYNNPKLDTECNVTIEVPNNISVFSDIIKNLEQVDNRTARIVTKYYADLYHSFLAWKELLINNGLICVVIGDSHVKQVKLENSKFISEAMKYIGMSQKFMYVRNIHNKRIPTLRDPRSGRFASRGESVTTVYPEEYVMIFGH